jgi:HPt (histidine-containing phosphotransfer) domain-containing protein
LNRAQLESMRNLGKAANRDLVVELTDTFIKEYPRRQASMQSAIAQQNAKLLEIEAHSLLGICGHVGADRMIQLCERVERCGREQSFINADEMLNDLSAEHGRFLAALIAYRNEQGIGPRMPE